MERFTPLEYIKIDIANHYGLDKKLWRERIDWVDSNNSNLEALSSNADKPILYSKSVREYRKVLKGEPTGLLVSLDKH